MYVRATASYTDGFDDMAETAMSDDNVMVMPATPVNRYDRPGQ